MVQKIQGWAHWCAWRRWLRKTLNCDWWTHSKSRPMHAWKTSFHEIRTFWKISKNFDDYFVSNCHRLGYHKFCAWWVSKRLTFTKLKEWGQPWRFFSATGKRGMNFLTELRLVMRLGYSLWTQRPNSSLNSGCTSILPTSPRYSNEHHRTKTWLLQYSGTVREFCWQNSWHQRPQKCQGFIVKCWISFGDAH